ncbi:MAG: DUF2125 domain-containing protein [Paracoccaceae bacterium]
MTNLFSRPLACVAFACALPSTALADVSALEVWESWKSYAETFGQTVSIGSQETSGNALILRDVTMAMDFPDGSVSGTLALLEFRERGDGTVAVTMAPDFPLSVSIDPEIGEAVDLAIIFRQSGSSIIASGSDGDISFDYLAAEISFGIDKLIVDGQDIDANIQFAMNDIDGKYALSGDDDITYTSQFAAAGATIDVRFTDPDDGGQFEVSGLVEDLRSNSRATIPADFDPTNPVAMFGGGFDVEGAFSTGASGYSISMANGPESFALNTSAASNSLQFSILDGTINYGGSATELNYSIQAPQIPFPEVTLGIAEVAFKLLMPLTKSDEPNDFGFLMKLAGLEISDMIWSMFDPAQVLPRDPATIIIDVSGQMNWLIDITDPEQAAAFTGEAPAELHKISVNDITLSAAGAEITGGGEFTFDNADLETFDGMPAPSGFFEMRLVGLNGLLDRLIQMGLMPEEQAAGMRMMLGLFARPADGVDTMTSTIEVKSDGSVFANGQQLK